jgi:hypothetical protein
LDKGIYIININALIAKPYTKRQDMLVLSTKSMEGIHMLIAMIREVYQELQARKILVKQYIALEGLGYNINQLCDELKTINEDITLIEEFLMMKEIKM